MTPPRLLFVTYAFPPLRAIGSVRCWQIAKQLARRGWRVEVLTVDSALIADAEAGVNVGAMCAREGVRIRAVPHRWRVLRGAALKQSGWERSRVLGGVVRRLARWIGVDPTTGWVQPAIEACRDIDRGGLDAIVASGPPFSAFEIGQQLSARTGAPLVLDYRDLWSLSPHPEFVLSNRSARVEPAVLKAASGLTVISEAMGRCMVEGFGFKKPVATVFNGFDPDEYAGIEAATFDGPSMVYAGRFYPPVRVVDPLLKAIRRVNEAGDSSKPFLFHYYGGEGDYVMQAAAACGAVAWVRNHGRVSRREALAATKGASVVAVVTSVNETATSAEDGILTGKIFEALAFSRPVLTVCPQSAEIRRVLTESALGVGFTGSQSDAMAVWLGKLRSGEWKANVDLEQSAWNWAGALGTSLDQAVRRIAGVGRPVHKEVTT